MKRKICIIEDEASIREVYQIALEGNGFDVVTASDGEEGLAVLKAQKPDLALIDILMPKKDGITLMHEMQADPELYKIPVIILTNLGNEEVIEKTRGLQSQFYLIKSQYSPKDVVRVVKETLHNKR
jgi:CheY-like chemotaxis protein